MHSMFQSTQRINSVLVQHNKSNRTSGMGSDETVMTGSTTELMLSSTITRTETYHQSSLNLASSQDSLRDYHQTSSTQTWEDLQPKAWQLAPSSMQSEATTPAMLDDASDSYRSLSINQDHFGQVPTPCGRPPIHTVISPFDGKYGPEVDLFLSCVWRYHVQYMMHPNQLLQEVSTLLIGRAARWWAVNQSQIQTWNQFDNKLRNHFNRPPPDHLLLNQFHHLRQEENEDALDFVKRARSILSQLRNRFNEMQEIGLLLQKINPPIKFQLNADAIQSYSDLESQIKLAKEKGVCDRDEPACDCFNTQQRSMAQYKSQCLHSNADPGPEVKLNMNMVAPVVSIQVLDFGVQSAALGAGCSHNFLDKTTYRRLRKRNVPMRIQPVCLQTLSTQPIVVNAKHFRFTIKIGNREMAATFIRISKQRWPPICIIGHSMLESLDLDINYRQKYYRFRDDHNQVFPLLSSPELSDHRHSINNNNNNNNQLVITSTLMNIDPTL